MKLLLLHSFITFYMTGILWLVQRVEYPLLAGLDEAAFKRWHTFHSNRITPVVGFTMIAELLTAVLICLEEPVAAWLKFALLLLTLAIWAFTFLVTVPIHNRLNNLGYNRAQIDRLVRTNWPRTLVYSLKAILLAAALI